MYRAFWILTAILSVLSMTIFEWISLITAQMIFENYNSWAKNMSLRTLALSQLAKKLYLDFRPKLVIFKNVLGVDFHGNI